MGKGLGDVPLIFGWKLVLYDPIGAESSTVRTGPEVIVLLMLKIFWMNLFSILT